MTAPAFALNDEQSSAIEDILSFLASDEQFFLLSGPAGTGKTFCVQALTSRVRGRLILTAPTNKAVKVLRETLSSPDYKPECRTIFSLLGLRLEPSGEIRELSVPEDPVDLSKYAAVILDEGSMVSSLLFRHVQAAATNSSTKFIVLGDPAQLPPVGEARSPVWSIPRAAALTKVMRHDNQILELATRLRKEVDKLAPNVDLKDNHSDDQGIWRVGEGKFLKSLMSSAAAGDFSRQGASKAIAWRNSRVDALNTIIRNSIFPGVPDAWAVGDRVLFTAPARDLENAPVAATDDEGTVERVEVESHAIYPEFKVWRLLLTMDDGTTCVARVLHNNSAKLYAARVEELASAAKSNGRLWKKFWAFKEAFHSIRYAYAITAHRSQGSTYDTAYVDWQDILLNRNRQEAFRCLYVACTRPKRKLVLP